MEKHGPRYERIVKNNDRDDNDGMLDSSELSAIIDSDRDLLEINLASTISQMNKRLQLFSYFSIVTAVVIMIAIVSFIITHPKNGRTTELDVSSDLQQDYYTCGSTPEDAKRLGCVFDFIGLSWMPVQCYDAELTNEFVNVRPWKYWNEIEAKTELDDDDLRSRSGPDELIWVNLEWHLLHCHFEWRRMHRAFLQGKRVDSELGDIAHTEHCGQLSLDRNPLDMVHTKVVVGFLTC